MLLRITVLQYKGAPPPAALAYMFDERGGTIGREECNLTLPDDTRVLSRVQAEIVFADGVFNLLDQGGNPSVVNTLRVGKGKLRALYDGDIIELCDYKLRVKAIGTAPPKNNIQHLQIRASEPLSMEELAPPILLDPDELTGAPFNLIEPEPVTEVMEMSFDMDVDFDDLDDTTCIEDADKTAGIGAPLGMVPHSSAPADKTPHEIILDNLELGPLRNAEHAAMLAALCTGLGVSPPPSTTTMMPQHMGIVMRRAMLRALAGVLESFTPEDLAKRLADRQLMNMSPPTDRKSTLWELFEQRHAELSHDAEDQFHSLFGTEFLKACEVQIVRLQEHK